MRMKAQAALVEALVASLVLASAGAYAAKEFYAMSTSGPYQGVNMQNAIFDIEGVTHANAGFGKCIAETNSQCIAAALQSVDQHYLLSYSSLQIGNLTVASGNYLRCTESDYYCFPLNRPNRSMQVCEYLCGD